MVNAYVMQRLPFLEKRADYAIKPQSVLLGKLETLSGLSAYFLVLLLGLGC
jgi:hypothetical protein